MHRRQVLHGSLGVGLLHCLGAVFGLLPGNARASADAFTSKTVKDALQVLFKDAQIHESDALTLVAPDIAENGTAVPLTIRSTLTNIDQLVVLATENPQPLTATYQFTALSAPPINLRVKLAKTQDIVVIARADGKLYRTAKNVAVSVGGCGG